MIALKILGTIALTVLASWGYRFGGSKNGQRWVRETAVGIAVTATLIIWFGFNWWTLLCLGLSWCESTYFKRKGTDGKWYNWLLVGIVFALVPLPYVIANGHHWIGFFVRAVFISVSTCIVGTFCGNVQWSEGLRGGLQIVSLPLLLI